MTSGLQPTTYLQPSILLQPDGNYVDHLFGDPEALEDGQYEIGGLVFGTRDIRRNPNPYLVEKFDITPGILITGQGGNLSASSGGSAGNNTADSSYPNEDGQKFGQDYYTGMVVALSLNVWQRGQQVYNYIGAMKGVWRRPEFRQTSNLVTTLRMCRGGRTRLVYGRPRNFKATYGEVERGWGPIDVDFQCSDESFYDDELNVKNVGMDNPPVDGLTLPATAPFRLQQYQESYNVLNILGDFSTWPMYRIFGPCANPSIQIDNDYTIKLNVSLDHTQYVTIDPRPWIRMSLKQGTIIENISGRYDVDSPTMRQMRLNPSKHSIVYKAIDQTLTSYVEVSWRNAWMTP